MDVLGRQLPAPRHRRTRPAPVQAARWPPERRRRARQRLRRRAAEVAGVRRGACNTCGVAIDVDPRGSATPRCKPCRTTARLASRQRTCPTCSATFTAGSARSVYCSSRCAAIAGNQQRSRYGQTLVGAKGSRATREASAPGLNAHQRSSLLRRWVRQRRTCAYCASPATTVDHVVPLLRGGTNHEGNLAPCCRPCNSGKAYLLLIEWRTGRRLPSTVVLVQHSAKRTQRPVVGEPLALAMCATCFGLFTPKSARQRYCSQDCSTLPCRHCGSRIRRTKSVRPEGEAICHLCRPTFPQQWKRNSEGEIKGRVKEPSAAPDAISPHDVDLQRRAVSS